MRNRHDPLPYDLLARADIAGRDAGRSGKPDPTTSPTTPSTPIFRELPIATDFPVDALPYVHAGSSKKQLSYRVPT